MAINYSVTQRANPKDSMAEPKWYANAQVAANYSFDTLCSDVEKMSTATDGDVRAVLSTALYCIEQALYCIEQALRRSESVTLGDLGTFAVGLSSTGTDTAEEFTAANISKARVTFRPARRLKELAKAFQYKRVEVRPHI